MPATFGYETGMAHGHQTYQQSFLVDVPSQRLHRIAAMEAVVHVHQICLQSFLVDVPRFELGASTMPR